MVQHKKVLARTGQESWSLGFSVGGQAFVDVYFPVGNTQWAVGNTQWVGGIIRSGLHGLNV